MFEATVPSLTQAPTWANLGTPAASSPRLGELRWAVGVKPLFASQVSSRWRFLAGWDFQAVDHMLGGHDSGEFSTTPRLYFRF